MMTQFYFTRVIFTICQNLHPIPLFELITHTSPCKFQGVYEQADETCRPCASQPEPGGGGRRVCMLDARSPSSSIHGKLGHHHIVIFINFLFQCGCRSTDKLHSYTECSSTCMLRVPDTELDPLRPRVTMGPLHGCVRSEESARFLLSFALCPFPVPRCGPGRPLPLSACPEAPLGRDSFCLPLSVMTL